MLDNGHWITETYRQRITSLEWKNILLSDQDRIIVQGCLRRLKVKRLGYGVVEIFKEPLEDKAEKFGVDT